MLSRQMIEVLRTNDAVRISYALMLLEQAGCKPVLADRFMASAEGGISAFQQRILVPEAWAPIARDVLLALDDPPPPESEDEDGDGESGVPDDGAPPRG
jgi:hypothetical protein